MSTLNALQAALFGPTPFNTPRTHDSNLDTTECASPPVSISTLDFCDDPYAPSRPASPSSRSEQTPDPEQDSLSMDYDEVCDYESLRRAYPGVFTRFTPLQPLPELPIVTALHSDRATIDTNETLCGDDRSNSDRRSPSATPSPYSPLYSPTQHPTTPLLPRVVLSKQKAKDKTASRARIAPHVRPSLASRISPPRVSRDSSPTDTISDQPRVTPKARFTIPTQPRAMKPSPPSSSPPRSSADLTRPNKKSNSYRAWPSYRQSIADRERNAEAKINAIRAEYQQKTAATSAQVSHLVSQLNRAIHSNHFEQNFLTQTATVQSREALLDDRAIHLDERTRYIERRTHHIERQALATSHWRDEIMLDNPRLHSDQADRVGRVLVQLADILKAEHVLSNPCYAFMLHRRISPTIQQLLNCLSEPHNQITSVRPNKVALAYYTSYVRELQYLLTEDEWDDFKTFECVFEDPNMVPNPKQRATINMYDSDEFDTRELGNTASDAGDTNNGW
jgi:hypothetical protein